MMWVGVPPRFYAQPSYSPFFILLPKEKRRNFPALVIGKPGGVPQIMYPGPQMMHRMARGVLVPYGPRYPDEAAVYYDGKNHRQQLPYILQLRSGASVAEKIWEPAPFSNAMLLCYRPECFYSGENLAPWDVSVEHLIPQADYRARQTNIINGTPKNSWENCVIAHRHINSRRGHMGWRDFAQENGYMPTLGERPHTPLLAEVMIRQIMRDTSKMPPLWLEEVQDMLVGMYPDARTQQTVKTGRVERQLQQAIHKVTRLLQPQEEAALAA